MTYKRLIEISEFIGKYLSIGSFYSKGNYVPLKVLYALHI